MNKILALVALSAFVTFAAHAQVQCQTLSNGTVFCTPAGGGGSSYR